MKSKRGLLFVAIVGALLVTAPAAFAHIERASYWPSPGAQDAGGQPTGGAVPTERPLFTALDEKPAGDTRVVCQGTVPKMPKALKKGKKGKKVSKKQKKKAQKSYNKAINKNDSIKRLDASLATVVGSIPKKGKKKKGKKKSAKKGAEAIDFAKKGKKGKKGKKKGQNKEGAGYVLRPSEPNVTVTKGEGRKLRDYNVSLLKRCKYTSIQKAVTDSANNDRVVIMPGVYTEPDSRAAPTNDPKCDGLEETNDRGRTGALSYKYQVTCPNDQSLVFVAGREISSTPAPQPPLEDRHGLPDEGACIRCNLQVEGSGVTPDDVVVDAGNVAAGNKGPAAPVKDVVFRIDRADGFVARNMNVRHAREHGFYIHEVDGYLLDHFRAAYNEHYGVLVFTSDHGVMSDCDAFGSGDSALYPGAAPETGEQTREGSQRYNTEITRCDMHHSAAGYSGTDANGVWVHHNDMYDNANGFTTDVFTAAAHPGFPQDSDLIENNEFYSNNFNPYLPGSDVVPIVPMPVGTGMWIAGGNNNIVRNNRFYDNWRRGAMLFAVPNSFVTGCGEPTVPECETDNLDTSFRNRYYGNIMGIAPDGTVKPNGNNPAAGRADFWWDENGTHNAQPPVPPVPAESGNCWYSNTGRAGTAASVTSVPAPLPSDCANSEGGVGHGVVQAAELLDCSGTAPAVSCTWFQTPPRP